MRIGIYVGSFNPVHKGHREVMQYILKNNYVDKVMMIPTGSYWDKNDLVDTEKRIAMCKYYEDKDIMVDDEYNDLPYTYMIMEKLREKYKNDILYLILGADNIKSFDKWKNTDILLESKILVLPRDGIKIDEYIRKFSKRDSFVLVEGFEERDISSSEIRSLIKDRQDDEVLKYLDKEIFNYIKKYDLYSL